MIRQTTFLFLIFVLCVLLMLINNYAPLQRSSRATLQQYATTTHHLLTKERVPLPNFKTDVLIQESARDDRWFGLQSTLLAFNNNPTTARKTNTTTTTTKHITNNINETSTNSLPYSPVELAVVVPHLIVKTRDVHRQHWTNAGRDVHMFAINTSDQSVTHLPSGQRWTRYAMYLQHNSQTDAVASAFRQARQFADYFMILSYVQQSNCFGARNIMLVDDDVRPCNCLTDYLKRILDWLEQSVHDWRIARFSIGTNGLVMQCSHLPNLLQFLAQRWRNASDFTFAIDYELSLWAMPYASAPIKESLEFTSRYTLFRHELRGESTLWNGEHIVARSIPQCFDPIVWVVGAIDRSVFYEWASFDAVRCEQHIVSPCTRADTPRRPNNAIEAQALAHCNAPDRYATANTSLSRAISSLHILIAKAGESCTNRCIRAGSSLPVSSLRRQQQQQQQQRQKRQCNAETAFVLADIELLAKRGIERPQQCLPTMSHTHLLGAHIAMRNADLDRPPLCNVESLVDDELGNALFSCDAQTSKTDLRLRLCPCALVDDFNNHSFIDDKSVDTTATTNFSLNFDNNNNNNNNNSHNNNNNSGCANGYEMRYGRCAPCAMGQYGGGANGSCQPCPLDRLRSRAYHSRIAARSIDECDEVSCVYGDDASRNGRCPSISRSSLAKTLAIFFIYLTVIIWLATERCMLFVALIKRI